MISILIVDDMKLLRETLKFIFEKDEEFNVIGTAENGIQAVEMYINLSPDIVLMDLNMPIYSGYEAIKDIKKINKNSKILVLTVEGDDKSIYQAFVNGADGYVLKDIGAKDLFEVIKNTYNGEKYAIDCAFYYGNEQINGLSFDNVDRKESKELTSREREVLKLLITGLTNEEIAEILGISTGRTKNIVADLIAKCMVKNRTQLAVTAVKTDLIEY